MKPSKFCGTVNAANKRLDTSLDTRLNLMLNSSLKTFGQNGFSHSRSPKLFEINLEIFLKELCGREWVFVL